MRETIPVWDIWIRLGHWLIVIGFFFQQISGGDAEYIDAHATVGTLLAGWVIFRILWGFIGPKYAQFSSFPPPNPRLVTKSFKRILTRQSEEVPGHSAIGGVAVYVFLTLILLTALTGMSSSDDILFDGPFAPLLPAAMVSFAGTVHPILSDLLLVVVAVHLIAITWHVIVMKEPLIRGMLTGRKNAFDQKPGDPHAFSRVIFIRGFIFSLLILSFTYGIIGIYLGW
ncbi:MAG TPA: hypothetical protein DCQ47_01780 [Gammaproteobacteria bacterium]|nr:hypothetical protein [Gammaproteobacteria bacterium]